MFENFINSITQTGINVNAVDILVLLAFATINGLLISLTYQKTQNNSSSESVAITLLVLPAVVGIVVAVIGNNIAGAFSLAGIFSIIKFRSAPSSAKDILFILFCAATGIASGVGANYIGLLVAIVLCGILFAASKLHFGTPNSGRMNVKILVPENMNAEEELKSALVKFTKNFQLLKMRTKDLGSIFELTYAVTLLPNASKKEFIDELRIVNGNLNINLDSANLVNEF